MRKLLALPFGLIFIGLLLISLTAMSLRTFAFEPSFYTEALKERGVFQDFEHDPVKYVDLSAQFSQLKTLPTDTQRQIITAALPSGWLEQSLKNLLRDFFDWLKSDDPPPPDLALDLRPIKDRLQGPPGKAIAQEVVAAIPTCAAGQSPQLAFDRLPECWPDNIDRSLIVDQVAQVLDSSAAGLSASIDVGRQFVNSAGGRSPHGHSPLAATSAARCQLVCTGGRDLTCVADRCTDRWAQFKRALYVAGRLVDVWCAGGGRGICADLCRRLTRRAIVIGQHVARRLDDGHDRRGAELGGERNTAVSVARHHSGGGVAHRRGNIDRAWGGAKIEPFLKSLTNTVSSDTIDPRLTLRNYV